MCSYFGFVTSKTITDLMSEVSHYCMIKEGSNTLHKMPKTAYAHSIASDSIQSFFAETWEPESLKA